MSEVCRIVVLGDGGVGKSALTLRLVHGTFVSEYDPTIEDAYRKQTEVDGKIVVFDILDTAGQDEYKVLREQSMDRGDVMLLVYGINNRTSFDECKDIYSTLLRLRDVDSFPVVLVGNKCDLGPRQRKVSYEMGAELAQEWGCRFLEASAKTNTNVHEIFHEAYRAVAQEAKLKYGAKDKPKSKKDKCSIL